MRSLVPVNFALRVSPATSCSRRPTPQRRGRPRRMGPGDRSEDSPRIPGVRANSTDPTSTAAKTPGGREPLDGFAEIVVGDRREDAGSRIRKNATRSKARVCAARRQPGGVANVNWCRLAISTNF
jgi:hypothetical protein